MRTWLLQRLAFLTFAPFLAPDAVESASAQLLSVPLQVCSIYGSVIFWCGMLFLVFHVAWMRVALFVVQLAMWVHIVY